MFSGRADITTKAIALLMEYLRALADAIKIRKTQQFAERDIQELEQLQSGLDNKLRNTGVEDTLARLMGLYEPLGGEEDILNFTRLHWVAHEDRGFDIEPNLKASNVGVNQKDILNWTPLHYAAAEPSIAAFRTLLTNRANVNARDIHERTPLHYDCWHSDAQVV
ncbi:ankyrin repeat [Fusarium mundagurra]|uniref:Ankyrin repeat n=1 Tax=Fusarium mundagurra TaxID=1567541 RepID=A0A8H5YSK4_9HYPO|nr:ankyrin repeat [Fusarium mundagurra]